ncbi:MAG: CBS domain-containing protein [Dokdonia sp.]|jgi:CBS domain-containing protein|nr:CBS domain-containing protein [Dokdonia sp.]
MQNTIAQRIYDFIKQYPPFNFMKKDELQDICTRATVHYLEKDQLIFSRDEGYKDCFFITQQGAIRLMRLKKGEERIVDICDEGDIFGLQVTDDEQYAISAIANEESIIYGLPMGEFLAFAKANKAISNYLIASFASNIKDPYSLEHSGHLFTQYKERGGEEIYGMQPARFTKNVVQCTPETTIRSCAQMMLSHHVGCLIIVKEDKPIGIVTNRELRNMIAQDEAISTDPITKIMVSPVICNTPTISVSEAQLILLREDINYLLLTEDGTPSSMIKGILGKHDIVVSLANNPVELLKEINRAPKTKDLRLAWNKSFSLLKRYLDQNVPLSYILKIFSELRDAVMRRAMELSLQKMETAPPVAFAWLALGSQGRKEQLLYTDQDNALLFDDVPAAQLEETRSYFLKLANRMNKRMHKLGYDYCPADMMASNPLHCLSLSEWETQFSKWIQLPSRESMLLSGIFFDYSYVFGDTQIVTKLTDAIFEKLSVAPLFFRFMAKDALKNPPPVSFFRQFLVESNGEHKDTFDIKNRAMGPLIGAARVLSLYHHLRNTHNTAERFEKLAVLEPENKELYESCAYAFKALLKFRVKQGILHSDGGRFINLETLTKADRLKLKRCFKPLRDVQEILRVRFQTHLLT